MALLNRIVLIGGISVVLIGISGCSSTNGIAGKIVATASNEPAGQRVVPLEGGQNFRDLGGYKSADGRVVRWNMIYRSGAMHGLTQNDFTTLERLDIRTVIDFRSTAERTSQPVVWPATYQPKYWTEDYSLAMGNLAKIMTTPNLDVATARAGFADFYKELPFQFAGQYRRMFAELLGKDTPLAFNCSAGKDRTGVAAALLLTTLGVSREDVINDYLLSDKYYQRGKSSNGIDVGMKSKPSALSPEIVNVLQGVDRSYIEAALEAIESRPGGFKAYQNTELGLSDADIASLKSRYLE